MAGTITWSEDFEVGPNNATLTSSVNTSFNSSVGTVTAYFDDTTKAGGNYSGKFTCANASYQLGIGFGGGKSLIYFRCAFYLTSNPPSDFVALSTGTVPGYGVDLRLNAAGTVSLLNNNTVSATSVNTMPLNTWFLIEWVANTSSTSQTLRIYNNIHGGLLETVNGSHTQGNLIGLYVGFASNITYTYRIDNLAYALDDWLGPIPIIPQVHWLGA